MDTNVKMSLWRQFGAAIDTLDDALRLCPDDLWETSLWEDEDDTRYGQFWYVAYHTLFWTDLFIGGSYEDFKPPAPFVRGKFPDAPYAKTAVHAYLKGCRQKFKAMVQTLTAERASQICIFPWMQPTYLELQLYSLRHVQEHAAQLNMILGHRGITGQDWIPKAADDIA